MDSMLKDVELDFVLVEPVADTPRTAAECSTVDTSMEVSAAAKKRPADEAPGTSTAPEQPGEACSLEQLQQRTIRMICGGCE